MNVIIKVRDGDFDLGLNPDWSSNVPPFHEFDLVAIEDDSIIKLTPSYNSELLNRLVRVPEGKKLINYRLAQLLQSPPEYSCANYKVMSLFIDRPQAHLTLEDSIILNEEKLYHVTDTFLFEVNPNHFNFVIDFFIETNGVFEKMDVWDKLCVTFNLRFPAMDDLKIGGKKKIYNNILVERSSPIRGKIAYTLTIDHGPFHAVGRRLKVQVSIKDRTLNSSNVVESNSILIE